MSMKKMPEEKPTRMESLNARKLSPEESRRLREILAQEPRRPTERMRQAVATHRRFMSTPIS